MARGPTVAELLAGGKKRARKIRKKVVQDVTDVIPPIFGPAGRAAPVIANLAGIATETLINEIADRAFQDVGHIEIPLVPQQRVRESTTSRTPLPPRPGPRRPRIRSDKQIINDQIQSNSLKAINKRARKKDGTFKKGWDQRRVMAASQKECTKERERLGLCKRKRKRGKNTR